MWKVAVNKVYQSLVVGEQGKGKWDREFLKGNISQSFKKKKKDKILACKHVSVAASQVGIRVFMDVPVFLIEPISSLCFIMALDVDVL